MNEQLPATMQETADKKRSGETFIAVGLYIFAVGVPVLIGTYWAALSNARAAIVNAICGGTLVVIGIATIVWGAFVLPAKQKP